VLIISVVCWGIAAEVEHFLSRSMPSL